MALAVIEETKIFQASLGSVRHASFENRMRFSERYGYTNVRELVQLESMDEPLRNALWSLLQLHVWEHVGRGRSTYGGVRRSTFANEQIAALCRRLWYSYFKEPLDQLDDDWDGTHARLREYFFGAEWYAAYDFVEFVANNYERYRFLDEFTAACNTALEREVSAYRFIDGRITRVTEQQEIDEIEHALATAGGPVKAHLRRALELMTSRDRPDYRNSIKESISSVESLVARTVVGEKRTLGQLLKQLEDEIHLHPALKSAFSSLYGYTSDEGGIRHALFDAETIEFEDARFFLVVCSAFINFVVAKVGTGS